MFRRSVFLSLDYSALLCTVGSSGGILSPLRDQNRLVIREFVILTRFLMLEHDILQSNLTAKILFQVESYLMKYKKNKL